MKKILLTILAAGLAATTAYSQEAAFELYEGEDNNLSDIAIFPQDDAEGNPPLLGTAVGVAYLSGEIADNNFSSQGELVYYLTAFTIQDSGPGTLNGNPVNNQGSPVTDGHYIAIEAYRFDPTLGNTASGPVLRPVVKSNTYKGAPIILEVEAEQEQVDESKNVRFKYHLLLGEGKGDAYIEYWYRTDHSTQWTKIDSTYLYDDGYSAKEGPTLRSGEYYGIWFAGNQLGNQVKTNNAQIRVTAYYGMAPSGWDGNGEFVVSTGGTSGGTGPAYELFDINDALGVTYWNEFDTGGYVSSVQKRDSILGNATLVSVGTYNDGVQEYPVYDFTGKESYRDQFAYGLTGHSLFSITDTNIIRVKPQTSTGN
jgi:hypothetical protein